MHSQGSTRWFILWLYNTSHRFHLLMSLATLLFLTQCSSNCPWIWMWNLLWKVHHTLMTSHSSFVHLVVQHASHQVMLQSGQPRPSCTLPAKTVSWIPPLLHPQLLAQIHPQRETDRTESNRFPHVPRDKEPITKKKVGSLGVEGVGDGPQIVCRIIHDVRNPLFVVWPQSGSVVSTPSGYNAVEHQFLVLILLPRSFAFPPQRKWNDFLGFFFILISLHLGLKKHPLVGPWSQYFLIRFLLHAAVTFWF